MGDNIDLVISGETMENLEGLKCSLHLSSLSELFEVLSELHVTPKENVLRRWAGVDDRVIDLLKNIASRRSVDFSELVESIFKEYVADNLIYETPGFAGNYFEKVASEAMQSRQEKQSHLALIQRTRKQIHSVSQQVLSDAVQPLLKDAARAIEKYSYRTSISDI